MVKWKRAASGPPVREEHQVHVRSPSPHRPPTAIYEIYVQFFVHLTHLPLLLSLNHGGARALPIMVARAPCREHNRAAVVLRQSSKAAVLCRMMAADLVHERVGILCANPQQQRKNRIARG